MGMCDCCNDCCPCVSDDTRDTIVCLCVCFAAVAAVVLVVVLVAAFGFVRHLSITVEEASLTRLALATAPATAFAYNLSVKLTVRNPNWAMRVKHIKPLEADYLFDGQGFDRVVVTGKGYSHPAGKTMVYWLVSGMDNAYVALGNAGVAEFKKENATGVFNVEVALAGEVRYQAHYTKCKFQANCPLKLQLSSAAVVFQTVKCKVAKPDNKNC